MSSLLQKLKQGLYAFPGDIRYLCIGAWQWGNRNLWPITIFFILSLSIALKILPYDPKWLIQIRACDFPFKQAVAEELSYWGDFPTGILLAFGIVWTLSLVFLNAKWRRLAVAFVLASAIAGLAVNGFRTTLGRPRPSAGLPDGLYGLQKGSEYHAFPSGHSATSFATAATFLMAEPPIGVPLLAVASGVGWSRMALNRHHPTDILVGGSVGLIVGLAFGSAVNGLNKRP